MLTSVNRRSEFYSVDNKGKKHADLTQGDLKEQYKKAKKDAAQWARQVFRIV